MRLGIFGAGNFGQQTKIFAKTICIAVFPGLPHLQYFKAIKKLEAGKDWE